MADRATLIGCNGTLTRSHDYVVKLKGKLGSLRMWMKKWQLIFAQDAHPGLLVKFTAYLWNQVGVSAVMATGSDPGKRAATSSI